MPLLALDTCFGAVSVAVAVAVPADSVAAGGEARVAHRLERRVNGHAERVFDLIAEVMAEAGTALGAARRVAITLGPGTFTGVRTTVAIARALALAAGAEVVAASSLAVMARGAERHLGGNRATTAGYAGRTLVVAADARRGQVYVQRFGIDGSGIDGPDDAVLGEPRLVDVDAAAAAIAARPSLVVGSGAVVVAERAGNLGADVIVALDDLEPDARDLLDLAPTLAPLAVVRPLYIRPPDAKPPADPAVARRAGETGTGTGSDPCV